MAGPTPGTDETIIDVLVEIPKGSRNKYEWDDEQGRIRFDRMLHSPLHYPSDYGFIPETLAEDGDELDALVLMWEPTFPGCIIEARLLGVFHMEDEKGPDQKLLCVPVGDPMWRDAETLDDVPQHLLKEIGHFFRVYKDLEQKVVKVEGWGDLKEALTLLQEARDRYDGS